MHRIHRGILSVRDDVVLHRFYDSPREAHASFKKSLQARIKSGWLSLNDQITVVIEDASGYFKSCPEIFPGYYRETTMVGKYLYPVRSRQQALEIAVSAGRKSPF